MIKLNMFWWSRVGKLLCGPHPPLPPIFEGMLRSWCTIFLNIELALNMVTAVRKHPSHSSKFFLNLTSNKEQFHLSSVVNSVCALCTEISPPTYLINIKKKSPVTHAYQVHGLPSE